MACDSKLEDQDSRAATVHNITGHIENHLDLQRSFHHHESCLGCMLYTRRCGAFVTFLYLFIKVLYILNLIGQFFLLNHFLGTANLMYGVDILRDIFHGREWEESGNFPRVTMCDFEVRVLGNIHHYTVQCVLMINMFNEKIFLFLWLWIIIVCSFTVLSLLHWTLLTVFPGQREQFVARYVRVGSSFAADRQAMRKFVFKFLGFDGVFCLRMISAHAGESITTDVVVALWAGFRNRGRQSPVEVFETPPALAALSSPSRKVGDFSLKHLLLGQQTSSHQGNKSCKLEVPTQNRTKSSRRKSDGYFTFV